VKKAGKCDQRKHIPAKEQTAAREWENTSREGVKRSFGRGDKIKRRKQTSRSNLKAGEGQGSLQVFSNIRAGPNR